MTGYEDIEEAKTKQKYGWMSFKGAFLLPLLPLLIFGSAPAFGNHGAYARKGGERWGPNYFPNVSLITQDGKRVRFFDDLIKDKVVVINFIYTTCPDVCPLETAKLAELQAILGDRVGRDVFLYSITIDPETDTPEVLKEYANGYGAGPGWQFLTGNEADITLLRKKLGLYIDEIQDEDSNDHNLSLVIGNQSTGRWMKRSPFENPYYLATQVGSWLHNWKIPAPNQNSYADAPRLRNMATGERLFRNRCAACHIIGQRDQVLPHMSGRLLGPDLLNVTKRRDRTWLARWLEAPDKMLAEKDPLAMELFAKHEKVAMPNMSLNQQDVAALIDYFETESLRVEALPASSRPVTASGPDANPTQACCQKNKSPVLSKSVGATTISRPGDGVEDRSRKGGVTTTFTTYSASLGCIFLLMATFVSRRSRRSTVPNSAGRPTPMGSNCEANE